ncbi:hypothetical protein [Actinomadura fibrosa]|uniref:Excreted virulence factor EspC, type VII ESX diderm n=1 Tax=Actinomadura fibrosa TaxID=111802 RepID=A0ABW2XNM0_9ACTN|nr:hypothetical protein [Actinomadura fibrosa]
MTENSIHRLLNTTRGPGGRDSPRPTPPGPGGANQDPAAGGSGTSAVDPAALRNAAKSVPQVEVAVRNGTRAFPSETEKAATALGEGWATAAAMKRVSSEWLQALRRLADEIDFLGDAVRRSADNRQWAEAENQKKIARIRAGGH